MFEMSPSSGEYERNCNRGRNAGKGMENCPYITRNQNAVREVSKIPPPFVLQESKECFKQNDTPFEVLNRMLMVSGILSMTLRGHIIRLKHYTAINATNSLRLSICVANRATI